MLLGLVPACPQVEAADTDVVLIEEHWELHVGGPDVARSSPQVTMIMSPSDNIDGDFFAFTLNHLSYPDFVPGGYQLERWHGVECVDSYLGSQTSPIDCDGEVITLGAKTELSAGIKSNFRFSTVIRSLGVNLVAQGFGIKRSYGTDQAQQLSTRHLDRTVGNWLCGKSSLLTRSAAASLDYRRWPGARNGSSD